MDQQRQRKERRSRCAVAVVHLMPNNSSGSSSNCRCASEVTLRSSSCASDAKQQRWQQQWLQTCIRCRINSNSQLCGLPSGGA
jgi:hypothetical protein